MKATISKLAGEFVVLDLGSAHSAGLFASVPGLDRAITFIEVDPLVSDEEALDQGSRRIVLRQAVAGRPGRRVFKKRRFPDCSSFLEPKEALIRDYGLRDYFVPAGEIELDCETVNELLRPHGITRVDLFKTDLEGMDFEILSSAPELLQTALCVQSELRFQPFYEGEAPFHQVVALLAGQGLELVSLKPSVWKYATRDRSMQRDGRVVWADAIFFAGPERLDAMGGEVWKNHAKQIILARLMGLGNFAQHSFELRSSLFPLEVRTELENFLKPGFRPGLALARAIDKLPLGWAMLGAARRFFTFGYKTCALYKDAHMGEL